jgi:hypothetical protein
MYSIWVDAPEWFHGRPLMRPDGTEGPIPNPIESEHLTETPYGVQIPFGERALLIPWGRIVAIQIPLPSSEPMVAHG